LDGDAILIMPERWCEADQEAKMADSASLKASKQRQNTTCSIPIGPGRMNEIQAVRMCGEWKGRCMPMCGAYNRLQNNRTSQKQKDNGGIEKVLRNPGRQERFGGYVEIKGG
jgi:hypothetical protein